MGTPRPLPRPSSNKREKKLRRIARLAAAAGIEPTSPGSEPGALPIDDAAVCPERDARPGKRERKKEKDAVAAHGWRQGRDSNPQAPFLGPLVFGTRQRGQSQSLPYVEP